jgi:hypothetical protein
MTPHPEVRPTRLADGRTSPPVYVPATVVRWFPASRLPEVEAVWSPAREELAAALRAGGAYLESGHWDWTGKVERVEQGQLSLVAIECEGDVQGLMAIPLQPRPAILTPGERLVYVDYLETAPWNLRAPGRQPRYLGAGKAMIGQAIHISRELGLGGRVGLHSLPQAEHFYAAACRMTRIRADPDYYHLLYFEYTEITAAAWLAAEGTPG